MSLLPPSLPELPHIRVLARGWMHGNVIAVNGDRPTLVDSGYHSGVDAVFALVDHHLHPPSPLRVVLTHTHSDHAGGVSALQSRGATWVSAHVDTERMVTAWDRTAMWIDDSGQHLPHYTIDETLHHGDLIEMGPRDWRVIHTPGHATGGISLFDERDGVLITGDALWHDGFGILNPWVDGPQVFDHARDTLDQLYEIDAAVVIPGHGVPFTDHHAAVDRARSRLDHFQAHPRRLQVHLARSCWGFLRLARPDLDRPERIAVVRGMVASLGVPDAEIAPVLADVFGREGALD